MPGAESLDEHRVYYYRTVARIALQVSRGAYFPVLVGAADYVDNPSLARLVPALSVSPRQFTRGERMAMKILAEATPKNRQQLERQIARACLWTDVLKCVANYYNLERAAFGPTSCEAILPRRLGM